MNEYSPFVQKYRPQRFSDLIGQEQVRGVLQSAFRDGSIAPAYLFSGPHGVGKTSAARIFSKLINCKNPVGAEPCCVCENCVQISSGKSIDVIEIDAASNRRIDEVRQLRENVKFAPVSCNYKVYIIDEVHMLTLEAFNALLKTLEEPPEYVKFILATTHPHKLPPTVLSRCQRIDFLRVSKSAIRSYIELILENEAIELDPKIIDFVVENAGGCMRDAAALLEQVVVVSKSSDISWEELISIFSHKVSSLLSDIVKAVVDSDVNSIVEIVNKVIEEGADLNGFLSDIEDVFRVVLLVIEKVPERLWGVDEEKKEIALNLKGKLTEAEIFYILQVLVKMKSWVRSGILDRLALELGFIKMARRKYFKSLRELVPQELKPTAQIRQTSQHLSIQRESGYTNTNAYGNSVGTALSKTPEFWRKVIAELIRSKHMLLAHILQDVGKVQMHDDLLELTFNQRFSYESMKDEKNLSLLKTTVKKILGRDVKFRFSVKASGPKEEKDLVLEEKLNIVLKTFGGKVIEKGRIKF